MANERANVVDQVARLLDVPIDHPLRVAVDGVTASGKTTFANELGDAVRALGRPCVRVSMDGFHNPRATRYRKGRESPDGYYDDAYDFAGFDEPCSTRSARPAISNTARPPTIS